MKTPQLIRILTLIAFTFACAAAVQAQATRTWVSGVGDDANPCSRTAPCKTLPGAISRTAAGGEIDALDPGGFGTLTITKAITIDGGGGQIASVLASGVPGINVSAGASDVVIIRNLRINGILGGPNAAGTNGINFNSGRMLSVENCWIFDFGGTGINVATATDAILNVTNTNITNMTTGIGFAPSANTVISEVDHTTIQKLTGNGITATGSAIVTVTNSNVLNAAGTGVNSGGGGAVLNVDSSSVSSNNIAFATSGGLIRISRNVIYDNNANYSITGGTIATSGDNIVAINGGTVPNGTVTKQ
jgi:hypothetical protein